MNSQEIKLIPVKDLVLWTENPRDPVDATASDQDIVNRALEDKKSKWTLLRLAKSMGKHYDFSELPTVVYHEGKPIVYDGNRRVILAKIKLGYVTIPNGTKIVNLPDVSEEIPCNVCKEKVAIDNVYRKHADSGSWNPLERDIFVHKFMGEQKSPFLILEEETGLITANPHLNKRFVQEEILKEDILKSLGFSVEKGRLYSVHDDESAKSILSDISEKVKSEAISTRNNRGKVLDVLEPASKRLITKNASNQSHLSKVRFDPEHEATTPLRQTRRTSKKANELFGGKLYLRSGDVSNLHRDITDLYNFYLSNKKKLSQSFPGIIRMSLRLLCETASDGQRFDNYLKDNFDTAKQTLDQDTKTTLAGQNVTKESIAQLLNAGAHNYTSTSNIEQTVAISIIIGAILTLKYGKEQ